MEAGFLVQPLLVNKVYPRDHPEPKFLDQSNHPLVAAAETPFLTTGPKSRFPLGFAPLAWPYLAGIAGERRKTLNAARDNFPFARQIGIGAAVTRRPLPHHRAYGSVHGGSSRLR